METICACRESEKLEQEEKPNPQDLDNLYKIIDRYRGCEGVLVDMLHDVQHKLGYLPGYALRAIAGEFGLPEAQVFGVASFYGGFHFTPRPANEIKVCTGTACHVRGAPKVIKEFEKLLGVQPGQHTEDFKVGLETVSCVGCCALAPAVVVNGAVSRKGSPKKIVEQLDLRSEGKGGAPKESE